MAGRTVGMFVWKACCSRGSGDEDGKINGEDV